MRALGRLGSLTAPALVALTLAIGPATAAPSPSSARALKAVSLRASDLAHGDGIELYSGGDRVHGQVTLDLCGATFASEASRTARHQVAAVNAKHQRAGLSTEAVLYDTPAHAASALAELRAAQAACPTDFAPSSVQGVPPLKYTFATAPDASWPAHPGIERLGIDATVSSQDGRTMEAQEIFQQRGPVLVGVYLAGAGTGAIAPKYHGVEGLAGALAKRLQKLDLKGLTATTT